jgi:hypothetical protein
MSPSLITRENREFASEMKFVVTPQTAEAIRRWAQATLAADPHAGGPTGDQYRITSLYFDTDDFDVFHRRDSYGRSKYRVRRYGAGEILFFERKLKTKGMVSKRRSVAPLEELPQLEAPSVARSWSGAWFRRRLELRQLHPLCQVSYLRTARVGMTPYGPIRLTLDEDLRAYPVDRAAFTDQPGRLLSAGFVVIEMKFLFALPAAFKHLVEEFVLEARPFSKYRFAACKLGLAAAPEYDPLVDSLEPSTVCLTS